MEKLRKMWEFFILALCATGISGGVVEPQRTGINPVSGDHVWRPQRPILRFACPVGFFRLNRKCYYLSGGTASWQQAHFHCKDRNSTLAAPDKKGTDRKLRAYLMGEQFAQLERWIGGIYNWQEMTWRWGVSGEKIVFNNFDRIDQDDPKQYAWHCILMDPRVDYKWRPTGCVEKKHYICEVPAGRIGRRRRYGFEDNLAPQNQRMKPRKGKKTRRPDGTKRRRTRIRNDWRRGGKMQEANDQWANGVKPGWGAMPGSMRNGTRKGYRKRHRSSTKLHPGINTPKITQIAPQGQEYGSYLGDGPAKTQSLAENAALNQFQAHINDLSLEEVLLKT